MDNVFTRLWDVMVYLTNNYSSMPKDFRDRFSEAECIRMRLSISSIEAAVNGFNNDEK